jgi:hypothetical protein
VNQDGKSYIVAPSRTQFNRFAGVRDGVGRMHGSFAKLVEKGSCHPGETQGEGSTLDNRVPRSAITRLEKQPAMSSPAPVPCKNRKERGTPKL